jgi:hypothetical protein
MVSYALPEQAGGAPGLSMPRKVAVEKQSCGLRGGKAGGWLITSEPGSSAAVAGVAASVDRAAECVHKIRASVSDARTV